MCFHPGSAIDHSATPCALYYHPSPPPIIFMTRKKIIQLLVSLNQGDNTNVHQSLISHSSFTHEQHLQFSPGVGELFVLRWVPLQVTNCCFITRYSLFIVELGSNEIFLCLCHICQHERKVLVSPRHNVNGDFCDHSSFLPWHENLTTFVN